MAPRMKVETDQTNAEPKPAVAKKQAAPSAQKTAKAPKAKVEAPAPGVDAPQPAAQTKPQPAAAQAKPAPTVKPAIAVEQPAPAHQPSSAPAQQASPVAAQAQTPAPSSPAPSSTSPKTSLASKVRVSASAAQNTVEDEPWNTGATPEQNASAQPAAEAAPSEMAQGQTKKVRESLSQWFHRTFAGHEHAFWGGLIALLLALAAFIFGPGKVVLVCLLVIVGVAIGQIFDGDPKIIRMIRGLFDNNREER